MKLDPQQFMIRELKAEFEQKCLVNDRFSLRAFAVKLSVSSSTISEMLNGKRKITFEKAHQFGKSLGWSSEKMEMLEKVFSKKTGLKELDKFERNDLQENILKESEFKFMYDWRYFAILACLRLKGIHSTNEDIANKLNIETGVVKNLVEELEESGFVKVSVTGEIVDLKKTFRTPDEYPEKLHQNRIRSGSQALFECLVNGDSDFFGAYSTLSVDVDRLDEAKLMAEDFVKKLSIFLSSSDKKTKVMELNVNLFSRSN